MKFVTPKYTIDYENNHLKVAALFPLDYLLLDDSTQTLFFINIRKENMKQSTHTHTKSRKQGTSEKFLNRIPYYLYERLAFWTTIMAVFLRTCTKKSLPIYVIRLKSYMSMVNSRTFRVPFLYRVFPTIWVLCKSNTNDKIT